jgi:NADH:ubiquinone oxidoreductase subunit C
MRFTFLYYSFLSSLRTLRESRMKMMLSLDLTLKITSLISIYSSSNTSERNSLQLFVSSTILMILKISTMAS